ncbi:MAG: hypothetical protein JWR44_288, partial [Hymenobacter sp.]|nr:hypothetical protein [Hymenobacter sp.]
RSRLFTEVEEKDLEPVYAGDEYPEAAEA